MADVESKSIPHELPSSHWLKATGQCVLERYLSATMKDRLFIDQSEETFLYKTTKNLNRFSRKFSRKAFALIEKE